MYNNCCPCAGLRFWKTGSRKIFAVKEEDIHRLRARGKGKRCPILLNSQDEDEDSDDFFSVLLCFSSCQCSIGLSCYLINVQGI